MSPDNVALQQYMHMIQIQITPNGGATLRLVGHEPPNIYIYIYIYYIKIFNIYAYSVIHMLPSPNFMHKNNQNSWFVSCSP